MFKLIIYLYFNKIKVFRIAPRQGFEPQLTDPETVVLPLDDRGIVETLSQIKTFYNM